MKIFLFSFNLIQFFKVEIVTVPKQTNLFDPLRNVNSAKALFKTAKPFFKEQILESLSGK
jgi:hypothetical protein